MEGPLNGASVIGVKSYVVKGVSSTLTSNMSGDITTIMLGVV